MSSGPLYKKSEMGEIFDKWAVVYTPRLLEYRIDKYSYFEIIYSKKNSLV